MSTPLHAADARERTTALVLGGGFGGLEAAIALARGGVAVTLVSDRPELFIFPTSIWIVTGEHQRADDVLDLRVLAQEHGFRLVVGAVTRLDAAGRTAYLEDRALTADYVIVALGAGRASPPGTVEHTLTIWGRPEDTQAVHDRVAELVARGGGRIAMGFGGNPKDGSAVRGGPVFELLFNVDRHLRRLGVRDRVSLSFFAPMERPGSRMGEGTARAVKEQLRRAGIEQHTGRKIVGFDAGGVRLEGGHHIDADLTVFVPAGAGHPVLRDSGLPLNEAGFAVIDRECRTVVTGPPTERPTAHRNVFVVGDSAALEGPEWRAKQGHITVNMARIAARTILDEIEGRSSRRDYRRHVDILCIMDTGNGAALIHRTRRHAWMISLPWIGHWLKKAWGWWYKATHRRWLPRLKRA